LPLKSEDPLKSEESKSLYPYEASSHTLEEKKLHLQEEAILLPKSENPIISVIPVVSCGVIVLLLTVIIVVRCCPYAKNQRRCEAIAGLFRLFIF